MTGRAYASFILPEIRRGNAHDFTPAFLHEV